MKEEFSAEHSGNRDLESQQLLSASIEKPMQKFGRYIFEFNIASKMILFLSVMMTFFLMAHGEDLNQGPRKIKVVAIIENSLEHAKTLEVIQSVSQHMKSPRTELVFETHELASNHPAFMDGRVGPLLGENVEFILWVVTCEILDFLPNKLRLVSSPSLFLTADRCRTPEPTENIGLFYIAIADLIEKLQWTSVNIIHDNLIRGGVVSLLNELSARFIKSSLFKIDSTSDDYEEKVLKRFIASNRRSVPKNQFLLILKNETLAKVLQSASTLMMTMGNVSWILVKENLQPEDLVEFNVNPRNANMLLFRSACDRDKEDIRKMKDVIGDLQKMLPGDNKYILTLTCLVLNSLKSTWTYDLKPCTERPLESMSSTSGMLMSTQSQPSNSCYPAFEVATVHEGGYDDSIATTVARWRPDTKLVVKDEFFPNQKYGLGNTTIKVSTVPMLPYVMRLSPIKNSGFKGFAVRILEELSRRMNFSYEWREPEDQQFGMSRNGSFTGLVGQLERREVDMVVGALTLLYERSQVVDYAYPYTDEGRGMLIKKSTNSYDLFKVFRAFQPTTWLSFGVAVVIVAVALAIIDGFKRMSDANNTIRGLPDNRTAKRICLFSHLSWKEALWSIYAMHLFQGGAQEPTSPRSRVIIMCWWLFTLLISTYYTANLTAHFTIEDVPSTIESLEDLAKDESIIPITLEGSTMYEELRISDDPIKQKVFSRMEFAPNVKSAEESLDMVRSGKYVFISLWSEVKTLAAQNCEDMMVTGKPYGIKGIGFALPRGSALTAEVSKMFGIIREAGLIQKWRRAWWKVKAACRESDDQTPKILDMNSLGGVFIVFAAFTLVAILILCLENLYHRQNRRKRISPNDVTRY